MSLALYRRYRPETFSEVIGQEHVTEPLQQAIRNGRVNHAYLFSGPRGCGKTTSARILARALNCEEGPTPTPCGQCRSCLDLARGGGGGLDVVEIDAASHGGVDDARDLRDRVAFAPASARYKVYIIDEAHMVTTAGFNALLKVVEEPPEHVKFIFATTEPEKVIATIRSRTHHYPFRLVPPGVLRGYLETLCEKEHVSVEPAVLPLVVRAGAGSVRDSLSVLDQLIAGAPGGGVTLVRATALLGYTDAALLDDVVDAFAAHDGAAVFEFVDRVIEGGHDPRRFVQDLLERLRDLVILAAVPDAGSKGLIDAPEDRLGRMRAQAVQFGPAEVSRAADLVNAGLTEMRGATAPRLQLELICARVLLPGAGDGERDLHARLDRLERRVAGGVAPAGPSAVPEPPSRAPEPPSRAPERDAPAMRPAGPALTLAPPPRPDVTAAAPPAERRPEMRPAPTGAPAVPASPRPLAAVPDRPAAAPAAAPPPAAPAPAAPAVGAPAGTDVTTVRRMWPDVLDVVKTRRRFTWMLLMDGVQVISLDANVLVLAFADEGKRKNFLSSGSDEVLRGALGEVLRVDWRLDAVLDPARATARPGDPGATSGPAHAAAPSPAARPDPPAPPGPLAAAPRPAPAPNASDDPPPGDPWDRVPDPAAAEPDPSWPGAAAPSPPVAPAPVAPAPVAPAPVAPTPPAPTAPASPSATAPPALVAPAPAPGSPNGAAAPSNGAARARAAMATAMRSGPASTPAAAEVDDTAARDDADADDAGLSGRDLLVRELGASVIEEIVHD